jgi:cadmium resistance protein CadD (predicted permease)
MKTLLAGILSFIATNLDDVLILMMLFAQAVGARARLRITLGQYLGIFILFAVSIPLALGAGLLPQRFIGLLGLIPIALGLRVVLFPEKDDDDGETRGGLGVLGVALLTVANGADNIGVYVSVFSGFGALDFLITAAVFAVMTGVWCAFAYGIGASTLVRGIIGRYKRILVPIVLIGLGVMIFVSNWFF